MPIKRNEFLQPLSREHHHGLLLCWKIKTGLKKNVELGRIKKYVNWFWEFHLKQHFEMEETYIFPILGLKHELVKKALAEHCELKYLFTRTDDMLKNLKLIEEKLQDHIRFEERFLFNEIQKVSTDDQLEQIKINHNETTFVENLSDPFWE